MKSIQLFAALTKVDELRREVWGLATAEVVDKEGEIFDYASSKPYFEAWSREISDATSGRSLGNVREMHQSSAVGKLVAMHCDDDARTIAVGAKIVDDDAWKKCVEGVYTGFSIGGRYVDLWPDGEYMRFTAEPAEISVVDNPAVPNAHFTAIKEDGSIELRKFDGGGAAETQTSHKEDGDEMRPEYEQKLDKAAADASSSLERVHGLEQKLAAIEKNGTALEAGLKELAGAFRNFTEGFARSFGAADTRRVARTAVSVSKEDDARSAGATTVRREGTQGDAGSGFIDAMKTAHANPVIPAR
jgi:hypothetical protein